MQILYFLLAALIGYLCGSVPFGYIYVRLFKGEDLTKIGSGRTGGTNSFRAAGLGVGVLTSFSDVLKGAAAVWLTRWLLGDALGPALLPWAVALAGVFAVVGHNWSVFLRFGGGAGTGPNVGWSAAIWPWIFPIAFLVMGGMLYFVGMASVASLSMAAVTITIFAIRYALGIDATLAYLTGSIVAGLVVTWALRPNIRRVLNGTERLVGRRARRAESKQ
jgi:glycerol-3-phosphate acyltransferase PlsY